jgi:hypothetical protein
MPRPSLTERRVEQLKAEARQLNKRPGDDRPATLRMTQVLEELDHLAVDGADFTAFVDELTKDFYTRNPHLRRLK